MFLCSSEAMVPLKRPDATVFGGYREERLHDLEQDFIYFI